MFLEIKNLTVNAKERPILLGVSLSIPRGGVHVIMGPNGSGKSTLCSVLMGHPDYEVVGGSLFFENTDLSGLKTDERARRGIFLGFQNPSEIPGVSLVQVMRAAINSKPREGDAKEGMTSKEFSVSLREKLNQLGLSEDFLRRPLNEHASGGEKKRLEMVQLGMLRPKLAILDEIDSGLDIDAMKSIAKSIGGAVEESGITFLIITHYQRLLQHIKPNSVHIMIGGRIVKTGDSGLVHELERDGYKNYLS